MTPVSQLESFINYQPIHTMSIQFITKQIHAILDYPVAISLMLAPSLLGLGGSHPLAFWLATITGAAAFVLTLLTDHQLGVIRVLPYWFHLLVDFIVGLVFLLAPFAFGFDGVDAWYYWINGAIVVTVVSLHKKETVSEGEAVLN